MKEITLNGALHGFWIDKGSLTEKNILNIHDYLMKKI